MPVYDYACKSGHRTEAIRGAGVETISCPKCGDTAYRKTIYATVHKMADSQPRMRDTFRRYQEASCEIDYSCKKLESETNARVPALGLWQQAKNKSRTANRLPFSKAGSSPRGG